MRDSKTEEAKRHINQGVKIKMDEQGNILIKRLCKNNVYVKSTNQEDNAIGPEIIRNSQGALEHEKPGKVGLMFRDSRWISFVKSLSAKASEMGQSRDGARFTSTLTYFSQLKIITIMTIKSAAFSLAYAREGIARVDFITTFICECMLIEKPQRLSN